MITLEDDARTILAEYFTENPASAVRVYVAPRRSNGPRLALAPDVQNERDLVFELGGFTFLISEHLAKQVRSVIIRARCAGFEVIPEIPFPTKSS